MTDVLKTLGGQIQLTECRSAVDAALEDFLGDKVRSVGSTPLGLAVGVMRDFLLGGKRLRPLLFCCGWYAVGGTTDSATMLRAAASLELFHTFALIHDDIMDASDTRRGRPTIHRSLAAQYRNHGDLAATDRYGTSVAILLGDLALVWSDEMFHTCGLTPHQLSVARPLLDAMRTEVMIGQYLDLLSAGDETGDVDSALSIVLFKTAKYTVERPLQMGATVAGADQDVLDACSAFALPIGEAFQLRDDLLGVFGDPAITGKSRLDDLREGKATALLAFALRRANKTQRALLRRLIGNPDLDESGAAVVRGIFIETGALPAVNAMIRERRQQALTALDHAQFRPAATAALYEIAHRATVRTS